MVPLPVANNQYQASMIDQPPAPVPDGHLEVDAPRTGNRRVEVIHQQSGPRVSPHCRRAGPPRSARLPRRCTRACCDGSARTRPSGTPAATPRPPRRQQQEARRDDDLHLTPPSVASVCIDAAASTHPKAFVIGGYRPGSNGIDALLVGYHDDSGLRFAGKVTSGFVAHVRREGFKALKPRHADRCPFVDLPNSKSSRWGGGITAEEMREMQWVRPELVAQIWFVEWTAEGRLRHAAFLGLRTEKAAHRAVRRKEGNRAMSNAH